ncbi:TPA: TonB-dependent receptor [Escherichia coli]
MDSAQSLSGLVRYYNNDAREPKNPQTVEASDSSNPMVDRSTIQRDAQLSYKLAPQGNDWLNADAKIYWSEVRINAQNTGSSGEYREQITKGARLENRSTLFADSFASHLLTYGGEYYRQEQHPGGATTGFPQAKIDFSSGWLQDEITLRDLPITLLGGTRYDSYRGSSDGYKDVDADKWSSRAGMTINPTNWLMLFGSYAQAFRAPTMGEMYNDSKHFSIGRFYTNYWVPNPNLRPETNETQEYGFGLRFDDLMLSNDALEFKASYFDTKAKDYISTTVDFAMFGPPKTNAGIRTVTLLQPALEALKEQYKLTGHHRKSEITFYHREYGRTEKQKLHFVFMPRVCNGKQKPYYSVSSLGARWNAAVKRAGIRRRNPYHTRHTFACWLLTAGANPAFIASQMGHETAQMVYEIYGMWIDDMNDEQVAMLNARLS